LLQKIYEDLQDQIDVIAELLRTIGEFMPSEIQFVLNESTISTAIFEGDSTELLAGVKDDLETLRGFYEDLMEEAELDGHKEIANYAQERILAIAKFVWMLNATLD
jgi:DNA-binding ferritin-like protein